MCSLVGKSNLISSEKKLKELCMGRRKGSKNKPKPEGQVANEEKKGVESGVKAATEKAAKAVKPKIESLTPEQEALLDVYCKKYLKVGLSCDTNKEKAEKAIKALYKQQGLKEPEVRWFDSPLACKRAAQEAGVTNVSFGWEGSFDAGYAAFYSYVREVLGCVEETEPLLPVFDIIDSCGPLIECDTVCFASVKPSAIFTDDNGELHNESGPAFNYPDGFCGHYYHGFQVPAWVIEKPQDITTAKIEAEENTELKRIMLEIFGVGRFITEVGGVIIDEDHSEQDGHRQVIKDKLGNVTFHVGDPSTSRMYFLALPPDTKTCKEAEAFLSGGLSMENQVART